MKRKVNRVGQNTLTVSLPTKWVKKYGVRQGDEVEVSELQNQIILSLGAIHHQKQSVILNLDECNRLMLIRHITEFYRMGIEVMTLHYSKPELRFHKEAAVTDVSNVVKKLVSRFIGLEIISQTQGTITLQSLMRKDDVENIETIQMRIFFLIKEYLQEFIAAMSGEFRIFHSASYDYHDNIAKFTNYYLRLLSISNQNEYAKARLYGIMMVLDKMMDKVRHTAENVDEMKTISPTVKKYLRAIFDYFLDQFQLLQLKTLPLEKVDALVKQRYDLVKQIKKAKLSTAEQKVIGECKIMLDTINDFSETYVTLHMQSYLQKFT